MRQVFVSDAIGPERLVGAAPQPGTAARLQWRRLAALYRASLAAAGRTVQPVLRPEIYQTGIARRILGVEPGAWHLCVKPVEHIRPFHGLPNVVVADWPFPEAAPASDTAAPFSDPIKMLRTADAIICGTEAVAAHLRAAGLERIVTLPPHDAPDAAPPAFQAGLARLEALLAGRHP